MEGRADRQQDRAPCPALGGEGYGAVDRRLVAADHDLARGVVIGGAAYLALRGGGGDLARGVELEAEERRHRPRPNRHGELHGLAAPLQETCRVADSEGARRRERRVLAERMAGDIGAGALEIEAALALEDAQPGETDRH